MKLYYVANARMPSEKAHGIQIAKMCEAFIEAGVDLTLVVPSRGEQKSLREFYGLRVEVPVVRLPALALRRYERTGYVLMALSFMCSSALFLAWRRLRGEAFTIYTVDIDSFSFAPLPLIAPTVAEMHGPKRDSFLRRRFFARARGIVAVNGEIAQALQKTFFLPQARLLIEPNGVDPSFFVQPDRKEARRMLGIPQERQMVLYAGRFYKWKGLEVLPPTSRLLAAQGIAALVLGGTDAEFMAVVGEAGALSFAQARPAEVPLWLAAADALLLIGTRHSDYSYRYTAPMKIFEYLAAGRPVIASETPALRSFVPPETVVYCPPDDAEALAAAVLRVVANAPGFAHYVERGRALAKEHTWEKRASRIRNGFLQSARYPHA